MATPSSSPMKSSLVLLLLLSTVVASQAHQVFCKNTCKKAMFFNGIRTDVGVTTVLEVQDVIVVEVSDGEGVKQVGKFKCPEHVKALEFEYEGGGVVKAQIADFNGHGSTLHSGRRTSRNLLALDDVPNPSDFGLRVPEGYSPGLDPLDDVPNPSDFGLRVPEGYSPGLDPLDDVPNPSDFGLHAPEGYSLRNTPPA